MRFRIIGAVLVAVLVGGSAGGEPGNPIALAASVQREYVRGYSCGLWASMPASERASYLLGIIALADALQASGELDEEVEEAVRLPLSAADYRRLVDTACRYAGPDAPVLVVLYALK